MAVRYNPEHTLADVFLADGRLLGAVPHDQEGLRAAERAVTIYEETAAITGATEERRIRAARREIVLAGGTPNAGPLRRGNEGWATSVRRHQQALRLAGRRQPHEVA